MWLRAPLTAAPTRTGFCRAGALPAAATRGATTQVKVTSSQALHGMRQKQDFLARGTQALTWAAEEECCELACSFILSSSATHQMKEGTIKALEDQKYTESHQKRHLVDKKTLILLIIRPTGWKLQLAIIMRSKELSSSGGTKSHPQ
ncbi:uncharacterized protein PRD47_016365 [Ara ararauna]